MLIFMLSFDILLFSIIHSTMEKQISCVVHWEGERNVLNYITLSLTSSMCVCGGGGGGGGGRWSESVYLEAKKLCQNHLQTTQVPTKMLNTYISWFIIMKINKLHSAHIS